MASHADSAHDLLDLDISTLRQFVELFPQQGLSKTLTGYLSSGISKHRLTEEEPDAADLSEGGVSLTQNAPLSQQDCLELMTVRIQEQKIERVLIKYRKGLRKRKTLLWHIVCLATTGYHWKSTRARLKSHEKVSD
jgi:hypothetical protein